MPKLSREKFFVCEPLDREDIWLLGDDDAVEWANKPGNWLHGARSWRLGDMVPVRRGVIQ